MSQYQILSNMIEQLCVVLTAIIYVNQARINKEIRLYCVTSHQTETYTSINFGKGVNSRATIQQSLWALSGWL